MRRIRINIQDVKAGVVVRKGNKADVSMIKDVFVQEKTKSREVNINIC